MMLDRIREEFVHFAEALYYEYNPKDLGPDLGRLMKFGNQLADAIIAALPDMIPDLEWEHEDYTTFPIGADFLGYYSIEMQPYDLAKVSIGVLCHEFGDEVVWKGPKTDAKAAANDHRRTAIIAALGITS